MAEVDLEQLKEESAQLIRSLRSEVFVVGLNSMLRGPFFSICEIDKIYAFFRASEDNEFNLHTNEGCDEAYKLLNALHVIYFCKMSEQLLRNIPTLIKIAVLGKDYTNQAIDLSGLLTYEELFQTKYKPFWKRLFGIKS